MPTRLEAWQRGIPLQDAWWHFAPTHLRARLEELQQSSHDRNVGVKISQSKTMSSSELSRHLLHSMHGALGALSRRAGIHDEMKRELLRKLGR
jgi:hypothetical protein